jgi:hypothetical protein
LHFNRIISSIQSLQVIWTVSHFMPCVWSQVSKKMSMKIPCNFQVRTTGSCATVRTRIWRRSDTSQCPADELKTSGRESNTVQTLGQSLFNTELDFKSRHYLESLCKPSGRHGNTSRRCLTFQNIPGFRFNAEMSYSEDHPNALSSRPDVDLIRIELRCF